MTLCHSLISAAMVTSPITTSPSRTAAARNTPLTPKTSTIRATSLASATSGSSNPAGHSSSLEGPAAELIAPASVEDHFAKALGDQMWSSLKNNFQAQPVAQHNTVAS